MRYALNLVAFLERMAPRERRLAATLALIVVGLVVVGLGVVARGYLNSLEREIRETREAIWEIRRLGPKYKEWAAAKAEIERLIRGNKATSIRVAANEALKRIPVTEDGSEEAAQHLSDLVSFEGKVTEIPVGLGKKKGKAKSPFPGLVQVDQKLEFGEVPWVNLFEFLDQIARGEDLLFVTKLEIARRFNNMAKVRAEVTLSTFVFQEKGAEEAGKSEEKGGGR